MSSKIPLESAIILIIGSSDELAAEHETMDMCGHTELRGHPRPRPLKSVAGTFHGKRAGFISPIYFQRGNGRSQWIFREFSAAPPMGQVGAPFVQFAAGYWLPPRISFGGRIKKSPAIRLNCGASRNLNTSFCCGEGGG